MTGTSKPRSKSRSDQNDTPSSGVQHMEIDERTPRATTSAKLSETDHVEGTNGRRQYIAIVILFVINLLNYMDRFTIAGVLTDIQKYYSIDDAQGGLLQTVFIGFYIVWAPLFGYIGDRYNRKWLMTTGIAVWVIAVFSSSLVPSNLFWLFVVLRGVVGIGEASYAITSPSMISDMFTGEPRRRMLMLFYIAIPVGSGLGYVIGSTVANIAGHWQWGVRVTVFMGIICLLLIIFLVPEPRRGIAVATAAENGEQLNGKRSTYWQDLSALIKIPTFTTSTIGYTCFVFVTGTLSWWVPTEIQHARAWHLKLNSTHDLPKSDKDSISLVFGGLTMTGGIVGVVLGMVLSMMWRKGMYCFAVCKTKRSDALVCALGAAIALPTLFLGLQMIDHNLTVAYACIFIAITGLCFNWSINVDLYLDVVVPHRRSAATAWQILTSHIFGDGSGPYLIGLVSDWLRGGSSTPEKHFKSLLYAFYIPTALLAPAVLFYLVAAWVFPRDRRKCLHDMGLLDELNNGDSKEKQYNDSQTPTPEQHNSTTRQERSGGSSRVAPAEQQQPSGSVPQTAWRIEVKGEEEEGQQGDGDENGGFKRQRF